MTDIGLYMTEYFQSAETLSKFNDIIKYLKLNKYQLTELGEKDLDFLISVVSSILINLKDNVTSKISINEQSVISSLKKIYEIEWQNFIIQLDRIETKIENDDNLTENDIILMDKVADAMEQECSSLYRRISGRF